jgi:hypothetical protein
MMALCALASARVRDGAMFSSHSGPKLSEDPSAEQFFGAAVECMPRNLSVMRGFNWMRACALMALYGIQVGKIELMHQYLGMYHNLVSMDALHDEQNWPKNIGLIETQLRRRLVCLKASFIQQSLINPVLVNVYLRGLLLYPLGHYN